MRIALNACSASGTSMSGIGYYTQCLAHGLLRCRTTEAFTFIGSNSTLCSDTRLSQNDRILTPPPGSQLWEQLELPELLTAQDTDVYHNPAFGLPVVKSCRYVCTVHDCIPRLFPDLAPPWLSEFFRTRALSWLDQADHLICASQHTAHDVMHLYGIPSEKLSVVYQATSEIFRPATPEAMRRVRLLYGLDRPYLLVVGRVELRKNVAGVLRAFRLLQDTDLEPHLLVFAGPRDSDAADPDGVLPPEGRHGNVIVTGYVADDVLAALYTGASVFCFPSFYEGFGRPVLEAMSCGAPVVTSQTSSLPEVGGDACLYVNPHDVEDLAAALYEVASSDKLRSALTARGLRRAAQFTIEGMGKEMLAVYRQVMGKASA